MPLSSVLLVKCTFITIRPQDEPRDPGRGAAHLLADFLQGQVRIRFDDQLIVDVADDVAAGEGTHGIGEYVPAHCLGDVLYELGTVGLDPAPFLLGVQAHICDGLTAEPVHSHTRLDVSQLPAGRQGDEEHAAVDLKADAADMRGDSLFDGILYGAVDLPPEFHDMRVGGPPHVY